MEGLVKLSINYESTHRVLQIDKYCQQILPNVLWITNVYYDGAIWFTGNI